MKKKKDAYESPGILAVELKMEGGLLAGSPDYTFNPGNPFGGNTDEQEL